MYFWLTDPPERSHYRVSVHGEVRLVARLYRSLEHHCTEDSRAVPAIGLHYFGPKAREEVASTTALDLILIILREDNVFRIRPSSGVEYTKQLDATWSLCAEEHAGSNR